jgi:sulfate transport system ATP-binding protein
MDVRREQDDPAAIQVIVRHVYGVGPIVKLELQREDGGELLEAEITRKHFRELGLERGNVVFVSPRNLRVFADDYCI